VSVYLKGKKFFLIVLFILRKLNSLHFLSFLLSNVLPYCQDQPWEGMRAQGTVLEVAWLVGLSQNVAILA